MQRRSFLAALAGAAAARAADDRRTRYYTLDRYELKAGMPGRLHDLLRASLAKFPKTTLVLDAVIAPHTPEIVVISGYSSFDEIRAARENFRIDAGQDLLFEELQSSILESAPYSPDVEVAKHDKPRIFELRQYHSPTWTQLAALHQRFAGPEIKVFHKCGIFPILYTSTLIGENIPNLTYVIPFDSLAAREKAWDAFGVDPDWIKARNESVERFGQITPVNRISIYRAAAYSPVS